MKFEIEKKFLVKNTSFKEQAVKRVHIIQAYLSKDPERTVRVRITDQKAWLTIKGKSNKEGTKRMEWENEIPLKEARDLLQLTLDEPIEKIRHIVPHQNLKFEIDEFIKPNHHLILAEIELPQENTPFEKPNWLGEEVTCNPSYYNATM
jgi:CYTH domain-containing protein